MGYTGQRPSAIPLDSSDIADGTITNDDLAGSITSAKITSLDATKLTGTVAPARMGSGTASSTTVLYGDNTYKAEPTTDLTPIRQDIAMLALYNAVSDNRAAYNLPNSFIDQFEDDTGLTTQTNVDRDTSGEYVSSIIPADGIDANAQLVIHSDSTHNSTSFTDSSSNNFTITPYDSVHHSTTVTKSGMGATSIFFDHGSGGASDNDRLELPDNATWDYGTGNFTWEAWVYTTDGSQVEQIVSAYAGGTTVESNSYFRLHGGGYKFILNGVSITSSTMLTNNTWHHVACERASATQMNLYLDGVKTASGTGGASYNLTTDHITIGNHRVNASGEVWKGYMTEIRLSNVARYNGSNFTPRTTPYASGSTSATGTLISDTQTASSATTKMSGVILYKDNAGTATLGTDLVISLSANGGTNWTEAASYGTVTPLFSTGVKMVRLGETTVTSGTAPVIKAVWANQASGSKETQLHGWAMNY